MALTAGTKLGSYEILVPLGAGGRGEAHRPKDTRLGRDVALKILPEWFAPPISSTDVCTYDVAKDGKRFLVNRLGDT